MNDPSVPPPVINALCCTGCGWYEFRPTQAVEVRDESAELAQPADCIFCEVCTSDCPEGTIARPFTIVFTPEARPSRQLYTSTPE